MQLIIILGLIAKLALASGDCEVGNAVSNIDYSQLTGIWFFVYHEANEEEDKFDCNYVNVYSPRGSSSTAVAYYYDESIQRDVLRLGTLRPIDKAEFEFQFLQPPIWNGTVHLAAIDYKRFFVAKLCSTELSSLLVYVGYRERDPDEVTLNDAKKALSDNGIDFDTLKSWNSSRCDSLYYNPDQW